MFEEDYYEGFGRDADELLRFHLKLRDALTNKKVELHDLIHLAVCAFHEADPDPLIVQRVENALREIRWIAKT